MHTKITKTAFSGQKIFVGLDTHKKAFKVTVMVEDVFYKTFSTSPEAQKVVDYLHENFPGGEYFTAYEAGFSGFWLHRQLTALNVKNIVVNPADIPTTDKERRQKEDKRDSRKIAKELQSGNLKSIFIPMDKTLQERILIRTRDTIVKEVRRTKQRIKSFLYFFGINFPEAYADRNKHWSNNFIKWLESISFEHESAKQALDIHIKALHYHRQTLLSANRQIRTLARSETYNENVALLMSIPGYGLLTAMKILTELETITRFKNFNHLDSFMGFVPSTDSSSDTERVLGVTPRASSHLRSAIIESAWVAIRNDPALMSKYLNYRKRMDENVAIIRIAKILLHRTVYVLRKRERYEKNIVR
jgi:transposase